jgi:hypothetical protein
MNASMSNLLIYLWIGVPGLTLLIVIKNLLDVWYYRAIMARFDRMDAWFDRLESRPDRFSNKVRDLEAP